MKRMLVLVFLCLSILLVACVQPPVEAARNDTFSVVRDASCGHVFTYIAVDMMTGVNYIIVSAADRSVAIIPRLDEDGGLYVSSYINQTV